MELKYILVGHCSAHSIVSLQLKAKGMERLTLCCKVDNSFLKDRNYINTTMQAILDLKKKTGVLGILFLIILIMFLMRLLSFT